MSTSLLTVEAKLDKVLNVIIDQLDDHEAIQSGNPHCLTLEQARSVSNKLAGNINMQGNRVLGLALPQNKRDAVNKEYVENNPHTNNTDNPHCVTLEQARLKGNVLNGDIDMGKFKIVNLKDPINSDDAATLNYVNTSSLNPHFSDISNPHCVTLGQALIKGDVSSGDISMSSNSITDVADPDDPQDGATKNYVDTSTINPHFSDFSNPHCTTLEQIRFKGNAVSGPISMSGNVVKGVEDPTVDDDMANKRYVDEKMTNGPLYGATGTTGIFDPFCVERLLKVGDDYEMGFSRASRVADSLATSNDFSTDIKVDSLGRILVTGLSRNIFGGGETDYIVVRFTTSYDY